MTNTPTFFGDKTFLGYLFTTPPILTSPTSTVDVKPYSIAYNRIRPLQCLYCHNRTYKKLLPSDFIMNRVAITGSRISLRKHLSKPHTDSINKRPHSRRHKVLRSRDGSGAGAGAAGHALRYISGVLLSIKVTARNSHVGAVIDN
ncbi:hypothetical protein EVAR_78452_1 [Eumeta japonica]|uniref:Uncharacterized protein n=1 Tax=Eumeta variegata TaxID=151549 RepID=A0A4C1TYT6_EUMVA|nr:hypothetical protein EVAR_78452_1 [Eumeta japonica]